MSSYILRCTLPGGCQFWLSPRRSLRIEALAKRNHFYVQYIFEQKCYHFLTLKMWKWQNTLYSPTVLPQTPNPLLMPTPKYRRFLGKPGSKPKELTTNAGPDADFKNQSETALNGRLRTRKTSNFVIRVFWWKPRCKTFRCSYSSSYPFIHFILVNNPA